MPDIHIDPSRAQFDAFKDLPRDEPIEMLNLIRYRDKAAYPADHPHAAKGLTGAEAYAEYARHSGPHFAAVGGTVAWTAKPAATVIGPEDERWDASFVARYPSAAKFLEMLTNPEYQKAVIHRQAAVETSRLIRTAPRAADAGFG